MDSRDSRLARFSRSLVVDLVGTTYEGNTRAIELAGDFDAIDLGGIALESQRSSKERMRCV